MKRILFYTGYQSEGFNHITPLEMGLGGSESSIIYLSKQLSKLGYDVTVTGGINRGVDGEVRYEYVYNLKDKNFDVVIGINYLHLPLFLEEHKIKANKVVLWQHNEEYPHLWFNSTEMDEELANKCWDKIDQIVCVSDIHKQYMIDNNVLPTNDLTAIDNGVHFDDWDLGNKLAHNKIPGRIVWLSALDRGLDEVLDEWDELKDYRPDLSLKILTPKYAVDFMKTDLIDLDGVSLRLDSCRHDTRRELARAEYWIYPGDYFETFCIAGWEAQFYGCKTIINSSNKSAVSRIPSLKGDYYEVLKRDKQGDDLAMIDYNKQAQQYLLENFQWEQIARQWIEKVLK